MATKLTFRARNLDTSKPLAIYKAADLPEPLEAGINRAVPALPTGMEKEEEAEKHLQDILLAQISGLITTVSSLTIPIPEYDSSEISTTSLYKGEFKQPRQFIHVQPFGPSQDLPDYDLDDEDLNFLNQELRGRRKLEVKEVTFEEMIDRLEKNSSLTVVTLNEAKRLLQQDDDLILLVYDYWLSKRLELQQSLIPTLKTSSSGQQGGRPSPYIAFRRRTEKMQTRKNRKNEEASYEAMLKLRRDHGRAVTLLELVKKREKTKKEKLNLTLDVFDKRYQLKDFDGKQLDQANQVRPKISQTFSLQSWTSLGSPTARRTYKKKRQQKALGRLENVGGQMLSPTVEKLAGSSEDETVQVNSEEEDDNPFSFRRREGVQYLAPLDDWGNNNTEQKVGLETPPPYTLTSLPGRRCLTYCRRRLGRGGRMVLDRFSGGGEWDIKWGVRPVTPPGLQDEDWDPYKVRGQEVEQSRQVSLAPNNKVRILDRMGAHNAVRALVDSQFVDLFATTLAGGQSFSSTKL